MSEIKPTRCGRTQGRYQQGSNTFSAPKAKLSKAEQQAIHELKRDTSRIVLTADNGVAMVVMDRQNYVDKSNNLLAQ